jgi:flavin reductase (DIM6/NTAB) family NADH-FMN oxidoreductase RutF
MDRIRNQETDTVDANDKKTALRMIPYGLYVLAGETSDGKVSAATVNWVTQASFDPPLLAVGVKKDSAGHEVIKESGSFALSVLGKGQQDHAFAFFKPAERDGDTIGGHAFRAGSTGSPILESAPAFVECNLVDTIERGDHSVFVGEVVNAGLSGEISGRPDDATLVLRELGEKTFYGG